MTMRPLSVRGVRIDRLTGSPVVVLREDDQPRRQFDIYIAPPEAASIRLALDHRETPRPLTHDLYVRTLDRVGVSIVQVRVTHVNDGVFFAEMVLRSERGEETIISCRPSDALAIALRASCPIFCAESLLEQVGEVPEESNAGQESEILDEFREFIENISPEDFGE